MSLYVDGQKKAFATDAATVGDALERAGVKLGPGDLVEPAAPSTLPHGPFNINIYRARPVLVVDGTHVFHIKSAYQSARLLALAAGLNIYAEDQFRSEVITNIVDHDTIGEQVTVVRAKPLDVQVDGGLRHLRTQASTVGEALNRAGINLGLKDAVSVPLTSAVVPGQTVAITRVSEAVVTLTQTLPRPVKSITDPTMLKGQTVVQAAGSDGQNTVTYRIHYRNGVETSRETLQLVSHTDPVAKVVVVGTKVLFSGSVEYWRPQVEAAAAQWGLDPNMMLRIMACESKGNATVISQFIVNGEHPMGLFQYLPSTWRAAGGTDNNILDGSTQIALTARKMKLTGTGAWACR